jgi:hypothetical protein
VEQQRVTAGPPGDEPVTVGGGEPARRTGDQVDDGDLARAALQPERVCADAGAGHVPAVGRQQDVLPHPLVVGGVPQHPVRTVLVPGEIRTGRRGALERPYRATGASWHLDTCRPDTPELTRQLQNAAVAAHLAELQDAPDGAQRQQFRGTMRLDPAALRELTTRIEALVREYGTRDDPHGVPVSFLWSLHGTE